MALMDNFISWTEPMRQLMLAPAITYSDEAVSRTETETATFLVDRSDNDSNVVFTRTVTYDAANLKVAETRWSLTTAPTVSNVTTNQSTNTEVSLNNTTVLTITGTNFGAADADITVMFYFMPGGNWLGPKRSGRNFVEATVTNINAGDTQITATVTLPHNNGSFDATAGPCSVVVENRVRQLKSLPFTGLTVV